MKRKIAEYRLEELERSLTNLMAFKHGAILADTIAMLIEHYRATQ